MSSARAVAAGRPPSNVSPVAVVHPQLSNGLEA